MFEAFRLKGSVGGDMSMDLDDTLATKQALHSLGHFRTPSYGLTEYPDRPMIDGLKSFQRANGLKVDGVMRPDGPTMRKLDAALAARRDTPPPRPPKRESPPVAAPTPVGHRPPLTLKQPVKASASVDLDDALKVKTALATLGVLRPPKDGLSPYPDRAMIDGIEAFQRQTGLRVDGDIAPDGPTVRKLNAALQAKTAAAEESTTRHRSSAPDGIQVAQVVVPPGATPVIPGAGGALGPGAAPDAPGGLPPSYRYRGPDIDWDDVGSLLRKGVQRQFPILRTFLEQQGQEPGKQNEGPSPTQVSPTSRTQIADPLPSVPASEPVHDEDKLPSKTTLPRPRPEDLGPPTEIFPNPEERWELIESFPDQSDELLQGLILQNSRGTPETQLATDTAIYLLDRAYKKYGLKAGHKNGGRTPDEKAKYRVERLLKAIAGLKAARPDASFVVDDGMPGKHIDDIQTQDTWKDGKTPTARERRNTNRLGSLKIKHEERGDIIEVPKFRHWQDFKEWYESVEALMDNHARTKAEKLKAAKGKTPPRNDR